MFNHSPYFISLLKNILYVNSTDKTLVVSDITIIIVVVIIIIIISTCDEGLVRHGVSLDDPPVHGELAPGYDLHHVSSLDQLHVHLLLTAGHTNPPLGYQTNHLLVVSRQQVYALQPNQSVSVPISHMTKPSLGKSVISRAKSCNVIQLPVRGHNRLLFGNGKRNHRGGG